jgi:hypothetical protein
MKSKPVFVFIKWTLRAVVIGVVILALVMQFGDTHANHAFKPELRDILLGIAFTGILLGDLVSLFFGLTGGILTIFCLIFFYVFHWSFWHSFPGGPGFVILALPGIIGTVLGIIKKTRKSEP